jgi:hypothetical protein
MIDDNAKAIVFPVAPADEDFMYRYDNMLHRSFAALPADTEPPSLAYALPLEPLELCYTRARLGAGNGCLETRKNSERPFRLFHPQQTLAQLGSFATPTLPVDDVVWTDVHENEAGEQEYLCDFDYWRPRSSATIGAAADLFAETFVGSRYDNVDDASKAAAASTTALLAAIQRGDDACVDAVFTKIRGVANVGDYGMGVKLASLYVKLRDSGDGTDGGGGGGTDRWFVLRALGYNHT